MDSRHVQKKSTVLTKKYWENTVRSINIVIDHILCHFCLVLLCFHARLFVDALWSPAGKGLTYWLSFVMCICDVVTFPLESWVSGGA